MISRRFIKFLVVGGSCTLLDFVLFAALHELLHLSVVPANILSYGTGLIAAFFINRAWTFGDSPRRKRSLVVLSVALGYIGLAINTLLVWLLQVYFNVYLAKAIAVIIIVFYNYLTNRHIVFHDRKAR
jgi:putative flippase GtrA